jgi:hypothetical protein
MADIQFSRAALAVALALGGASLSLGAAEARPLPTLVAETARTSEAPVAKVQFRGGRVGFRGGAFRGGAFRGARVGAVGFRGGAYGFRGYRYGAYGFRGYRYGAYGYRGWRYGYRPAVFGAAVGVTAVAAASPWCYGPYGPYGYYRCAYGYPYAYAPAYYAPRRVVVAPRAYGYRYGYYGPRVGVRVGYGPRVGYFPRAGYRYYGVRGRPIAGRVDRFRY